MCLLLPALSASAQAVMQLNNTELVLGGGGMTYIGDLNNQSMLTLPRWAGGLGMRWRLGNRWAIMGEARLGQVACEKDYLAWRNLSFRSHIAEVAVTVHFNFRPYGHSASDARWTPYLYGGLGAFHFSPESAVRTADGTTQWVDLHSLGTEGQYLTAFPDRTPYHLLQLCLPFGFGVKVRLNRTFTLSAEYGFRKTWTDYLDDVSTTYVGSEALNDGSEQGQLAARLADRSAEVEGGQANAQGIKRGDDSLDDWYSSILLSIGINLETLLGWTRSKRCEP